MTKRLLLVFTLLLLLPSAAARAQTENVEYDFPNGSSVLLGFEGDRVTSFYYYGSRRVGRSIHECELDLARGDGPAVWEYDGGTTTIRSGAGRREVRITVSRVPRGYAVAFAGSRKGDFCGAGVSLPRRITLTRRRGGRYAGRISM